MEKRKRAKKSSKPATTEQILGSPSDVPIPTKWQRHFKRLVTLQNEYLRRRDGLLRDVREELSDLHIETPGDAGTDDFDRDFALGLLSSDQNALYEIQQALNRIRNGTYGICEATGRPIEANRLAAIPWTRYSKEAENRIEKSGGGDRTRLSPRERLPHTSASSQEEPAESDED